MQENIFLNRYFSIGNVDNRLFSGFIEHLGRAIYTGIYEPGHPASDSDGFRKDVLELIRALDMPLIRYPGGNFVSNYNWKDGIGPVSTRPVRMELAWNSIEPNTFGTDEFMKWCAKAGTSPMMTVNLGTGDAKSAGELVEYCNFPKGTYWSDLRRKNASEKPYGVRVWCLGNEMDGRWQLGAKKASEYGSLARETAKIMKGVDPEIETVVCGSCTPGMPTFGEWDESVLSESFGQVDYLSIHTYAGDPDGNVDSFLLSADAMSRQIDETVAFCDAVSAKRKSSKKIHISFDEWNVWTSTRFGKVPPVPSWRTAFPQLEEKYTMLDALVVGDMLISLLNHADRVKIACLSQSVNVLAPVMTAPGGGAWRQTIYYPYLHASKYGRGTVLRHGGSENGKSPLRYAAVLHDSGELVLFAVNRSKTEEAEIVLNAETLSLKGAVEWIELANTDFNAFNGPGKENVSPRLRKISDCRAEADMPGIFKAKLSPLSWNVIRFN